MMTLAAGQGALGATPCALGELAEEDMLEGMGELF